MKEFLYNNLVNSTGTLTIKGMLLNFAAACVIASLIYISYRVSHSGPIYSERFNVSLVMLTLVTTLVMNVIGNNIALSLGMVGALSIVRFRTAIKDPRDTAYIFWCIAVGICCGVSDYILAAIGSVIIFLFLILFGFIRNNERIMVIVTLEQKASEELEKTMDSMMLGKAVLRVQNFDIRAGEGEVIYEISDTMLKKAEQKQGALIKNLSAIDGISSVNIVRQDDEINQ